MWLEFSWLYISVGSCEVAFSPTASPPKSVQSHLRGDKAGADSWRRGDLWSTPEQLMLLLILHRPMPRPLLQLQESSGVSAVYLLNPAHSVVCDACQFPRLIDCCLYVVLCNK